MRISLLIAWLLFFALLVFMGFGISALPFKIFPILLFGLIFSILTIINLETGLYALILVVPYTMQFQITKFGNLQVAFGTDDALIMLIILSWLAGVAIRKEPLIAKTPLNWPLLAFFTVGVFSFTGGHMRFGKGTLILAPLHLFKFYEYVLIYYIVISAIKNVEQIKKFLWMSIIVVSAIAFSQLIVTVRGGGFALTAPPSSEYIRGVFDSMYAFYNEAILATYYSFFLSFLLVMALDAPPSRRKTVLIALCVLISFGIFNTYSRSAYLGTIVGFVVLAMFKEKRFFLILLALLLFSPVYMQSAVFKRITWTVQSFHPTLTFDETAAVRIVLWKKAIGSFLKSPILGTGFWTSRWALPGEPHSQYFAILLDGGIVGFSVFCWMIVRMFKNALNLTRRADTDFLKALGLGYMMGLACILTVGFFGEPLEAFRIIGPLWFVTGLVTSANRILSEKSDQAAMGGA